MTQSAPSGGVMLKGLFCLAGAGVTAITLMACYGMPPCDTPAPDGGTDPYHCYDVEPCDTTLPDGGSEPSSCDGTVNGDAGTQPVDAGTHSGH